MTQPMKKAGWNQSIFATSATQKEELGALRRTREGRAYRYAQAGAAALHMGMIGIAPAVAAEVTNEACASAHAIGDVIVTETITASLVAYAENYFAGGYFCVNDATGQGQALLIEASTAVAIGGTSITLTLADPIRVALVAATSEFTLVESPWRAVTESATEENMPIGVAPVAVPIGYYYWAQTHGMASVLANGAIAVGSVVVLGAVAGSVKAIPTPLDIDINFQVGIAVGSAGVDTEYTPIFLTID